MHKHYRLLILFLLLGSIFVYSEISSSSINWLSRSHADTLYCQLYGNCYISNLVVWNLSLIGDVFNISIYELNVTAVNATILCLNESCIDDWSHVNISDTNESTRFNTLTDTNCVGTDKMVGVDVTGLVECSADIDTNTHNQTQEIWDNVFNGSIVYTWNVTDWLYNNQLVNTTQDIRNAQLVNTTAEIRAAQNYWNDTDVNFKRTNITDTLYFDYTGTNMTSNASCIRLETPSVSIFAGVC